MKKEDIESDEDESEENVEFLFVKAENKSKKEEIVKFTIKIFKKEKVFEIYWYFVIVFCCFVAVVVIIYLYFKIRKKK